YYGFSTDYANYDVDIVTARLEHDFGDAMTLSSQLRYSSDRREYRESEADIPKGTPAGTPVTAITVARDAFPGFQGSQSAGFWDEQTDLTMRVPTGAVAHAIVTGLELSSEHPRLTYLNQVGLPATNLA